ncbi:potassium voltage-gated channel subfamily KQT member 1-like [Convolutriloba macropyga]|uniref:potassium voltage-gated channel subfamily KQT member 1-like n=1 Tax=Convolutriloba macropyga TaxID=536237 RepID=UPI003F51D77F
MDMELNLMGRRVREGYVRRQSKYNTRYRSMQNAVYTFLERPQGFLSITYHVTVFALIFICLLLSVISSAEVERRENKQHLQKNKQQQLKTTLTTKISSISPTTPASSQSYPSLKPSQGTVSKSESNFDEEGELEVPDDREQLYTQINSDYGEMDNASDEPTSFSEEANKILHKLEIVLIVIFSVDLVLRVWSAGCRSRFQTLLGRLRFIKQPFTFLDIMICVISVAIIVTGTENKKVFATSSLRGLRFLQILRIVRMDRRGGTWRLLGSVIYLHRQELVTTFYIGFLGLIFASLLMYNLENTPPSTPTSAHSSHPNSHTSPHSNYSTTSGGSGRERGSDPEPQFQTYADCLWWGIVTLTTVGYGDKVPTTSGGKIVASFFAIMGISFFALPAGILGSGFALKVQEQQRQKHFARRRHPAATLLQCVWRCYAAGEESLSVATWTIHVVTPPPTHHSSSFSPSAQHNNQNSITNNIFFGSATNPLSRKLTGGNLIERIPSIRGRKGHKSGTNNSGHHNQNHTHSSNNGHSMSLTGKPPPNNIGKKFCRSSLNLNHNPTSSAHHENTTAHHNFTQLHPDTPGTGGVGSNGRKGSILSLNFEAYFPGGFFSNPSSRKNSFNESENEQEEAPKRLTKLRPKHKIAIRFIRRMKYFRARIKFKEALKPYDVKDVIEQYASGHVDLITRVKDIQSKFALIVGQKDRKKQESSFSKLTVAARVVKIENQLTHLERKLDHLIYMYRKDKTQAVHNMHVQNAISSSEDEGTPMSRQQRVPPSQLFVKTRQMDLLSPIISRSRSHSQPNALFLEQEEESIHHSTGSDILFQSTPTVSRQPSCFLNVPPQLEQTGKS